MKVKKKKAAAFRSCSSNPATIINRDEISDDIYRKILDKETHHDHVIIKDEDGVLRWKANPKIRVFLDKISLNDLCPLLCQLGYDQNSEVYRKLYRDMGYSLFGYWEVFYWEVNNEEAENYKPNPLGCTKKIQ